MALASTTNIRVSGVLAPELTSAVGDLVVGDCPSEELPEALKSPAVAINGTVEGQMVAPEVAGGSAQQQQAIRQASSLAMALQGLCCDMTDAPRT